MAKTKTEPKAKGKKAAKAPSMPKGASPSTQHFFAKDEDGDQVLITVALCDGDRVDPEAIQAARLVTADEHGLLVEYDARGSTRRALLPPGNWHHLRLKIGETKENDPAEVKWAAGGANHNALYGDLIGDWVNIDGHDGSRPMSSGWLRRIQYGVIGAVDAIGIGYAYSAYGSTYVAVINPAFVSSVWSKVGAEEED